MESSDDLAAVDIEMVVYKFVLCVVVVPVFGIVAPMFLLQQAVVEAYRLIRRLTFVIAQVELPQVEQIRFQGYGFYYAAGVVAVGLFAMFFRQYRQAWRPATSGRRLPDAAGVRRFRDVPASISNRIAPRIERLWHDIAQTGAPPRLLCFASTGLAACVTELDARSAIALSTGLLDRMAEPNDRLADVIVLHELAHVVGRDEILFRRTTAFVAAFRYTFTTFIVAMAAVFVISSITEITDLGGIETRSPSAMAFFTSGVRDLLFPYVGMLLALRYIALIVMLTELRADLRAAMALGGLPMFAATIRGAEWVRGSTTIHLIRSWAGTKVSHLTAQERLALLERPERLQSPKYRYFIASIALAVFLLVNGALAFSGFDCVLQVGIVATLAALNAITVALTARSMPVGAVGMPWLRPFLSALVVVAVNALILFEPSDVMGMTGEVVVALTDPNFASAEALRQALSNWYVAAAKPVVEAIADRRLFVWIATVWGSLVLLGSLRAIRGAGAALFGGCLAALLTVIVAACAPFATYLMLPGALWNWRDQIALMATRFGPPLPVVFAALAIASAVAISATVGRSRSATRA